MPKDNRFPQALCIEHESFIGKQIHEASVQNNALRTWFKRLDDVLELAAVVVLLMLPNIVDSS